MTNERARARALCMNEYDRNIVSLLSKLFKVYRFKMYCSSLQRFSVAGNLTEIKHFLFSLQATVLNKKPCTSRLIPHPTESTLGWQEILLPSTAETECSRSKLGMREKAKLPQRPRLPPLLLLLPGMRLGR